MIKLRSVILEKVITQIAILVMDETEKKLEERKLLTNDI